MYFYNEKMQVISSLNCEVQETVIFVMWFDGFKTLILLPIFLLSFMYILFFKYVTQSWTFSPLYKIFIATLNLIENLKFTYIKAQVLNGKLLTF